MVGLTLLRLIVTAGVMVFIGRTTSIVIADVRVRLIQALSQARWSYFVSQKAGRLANALSQEIAKSGQALMVLCDFVAAAAQAVVVAAVAFLISWEASAFALLMGCVNVVSFSWLMQIMRRYNRHQTRLAAKMASGLIDNLANMKSLKAMGAEGRAAKLLGHDVAASRRTETIKVVIGKLIDALQELIKLAALIGLLLFMLKIAVDSIEHVFVILVLFMRLMQGLGRMQRSYRVLVNSEAPFEHVQELLETTEASGEAVRGGTRISLERELRLDNVSFSYGKGQVLNGVTLTIPASSFVCLSGPSGSGKTTVLDIVTGLLRPQFGQVLIDGVPLAEVDLRTWRKQIGYAPQDLVLLHDTILANVTLADPKISEAEVEQALRLAGAWDFIASLPEGVHTIVGERGMRFSGGQRQRIALARALARGPRLLILDEVTSSLDAQTEEEICKELKGLRGKVTILAASHRLSLSRLADEVYKVENGTFTKIPPRVLELRYHDLDVATI